MFCSIPRTKRAGGHAGHREQVLPPRAQSCQLFARGGCSHANSSLTGVSDTFPQCLSDFYLTHVSRTQKDKQISTYRNIVVGCLQANITRL